MKPGWTFSCGCGASLYTRHTDRAIAFGVALAAGWVTDDPLEAIAANYVATKCVPTLQCSPECSERSRLWQAERVARHATEKMTAEGDR